MRVDAINPNVNTTKVMPLKNAYVGKIPNSETLKTDVFQKQKEVNFGDVEGAAMGATLGAIAGAALCAAAGPLGFLAAYYIGAAAGGAAGHFIQEEVD